MALLTVLFSGIVFILSRILNREQDLYDFSAYEYPASKAE